MEKEKCSGLAGFTPDQIAAAAYTFATALSKNSTKDETAVLSSFFFNVGSVLGLIARQEELIENCRTRPGEKL